MPTIPHRVAQPVPLKLRSPPPILERAKTMTLAMIVILLGIAAWLVKSIVAPGKEQEPSTGLSLLPKHSEYKQLRIEDHRSIDRSVSPPRE